MSPGEVLNLEKTTRENQDMLERWHLPADLETPALVSSQRTGGGEREVWGSLFKLPNLEKLRDGWNSAVVFFWS